MSDSRLSPAQRRVLERMALIGRAGVTTRSEPFDEDWMPLMGLYEQGYITVLGYVINGRAYAFEITPVGRAALEAVNND